MQFSHPKIEKKMKVIMEILVLWNKITTQKKSLLHIYFFHFIPKWVEDMDSISSFHTIINHTKAQFIKIHIYNDSLHPSSFSYLCSSFAHYKIEKPNVFTTDVGRGVGGVVFVAYAQTISNDIHKFWTQTMSTVPLLKAKEKCNKDFIEKGTEI